MSAKRHGLVPRARRAARSMGRDLLAKIAAERGYELVQAGSRPTTPPSDEYEVVPKGAYDLVPRNFYSPVPDLSLLPDDIWDRRSDLSGIDLRTDEAMAWIEGELASFLAEFDVPKEDPGLVGQFFLRNQNYESVDAELLYAIIRARKPRQVVELGSGFTTLLIGEAARRNAADGAETRHLAYDPYPRAQIFGKQPPPPTEFEPLSATEVPVERLARLEPGDILFVDTTHTVKLGSDVNHIILDLLPTVAPGVLIHFHDIFLPWEYPRVWFEEMDYYWAEQYLLQAFLAFNDSFRVVLPAQAVARTYPDRIGALIDSFGPGVRPGAFWLTRQDGAGS